MPKESLQSLLKQACDCAGDVGYYHGYSGRGMYGSRCVGIVGGMHECMAVVSEVIKTKADQMTHADPEYKDHAEQEFYETVDTLLQFNTDDMARDIIVYWPTLKAE